MKTTKANRIGKAAAVLSAVFAILYSIFQLLTLLKWMPHPDDLFWMFLPSLLLAYTFIITIICLHYSVKDEKKIYTAIAVAFALLYCAFVSMVYFTQLAVIIPLLRQQKIDDNHPMAFSGQSLMVAVDCIGYACMNAATLFTAFAFRSEKENRWLYRSLLANGLQTPVVLAAFFIPAFLFVGALWMITLPMAMICAVIFFGKQSRQSAASNFQIPVSHEVFTE